MYLVEALVYQIMKMSVDDVMMFPLVYEKKNALRVLSYKAEMFNNALQDKKNDA